jgi:hypothetical protein
MYGPNIYYHSLRTSDSVPLLLNVSWGYMWGVKMPENLLTELGLRRLRAEGKIQRVVMVGGLSGRLVEGRDGRRVAFYYRFRLGKGRSADFYCGSWPERSLRDIRARRDWA